MNHRSEDGYQRLAQDLLIDKQVMEWEKRAGELEVTVDYLIEEFLIHE